MAKKHTVTKTAVWVASIVSVLFLAVHVLASTQVTYYDTTDLGLLTKLPITYWLGLSYLGVLLYVNRKSEQRTIIVVVLISLYLFGIPVLVRENKAEFLSISYFLSHEGASLPSAGHLELTNLYPWDFRNWPGYFFLVAFLTSSAGLPVTVLCDFFPLLTIALLGITTYSILRLYTNKIFSSLGALWFIASFWTRQNYFSPQATAFIMYFAILLLLTKLFIRKKSIAFPAGIILLFTAIVTTHLLTSFIIFVGIFAVYVSYKIIPKRFKIPPFYSFAICILLAIIFFSYQSLVIQRSFSTLIDTLYAEFTRQETHLSVVTQGRIVSSPGLQLELVSTYSIAIINGIIALSGILITALKLLFHKKIAKTDVFFIAWVIIAGVLGVFVRYGGEALIRSFMFMLLPSCYFAIKFFGKKPQIFILVLVILIFLHIPAHYTSDEYLYVPTSELKGSAFFAKYAPSATSFYYENLAPIGFFNENFTGTHIVASARWGSLYSLPSDEFIDATTSEAEFIISSNLQKNFYQYFYGVDLLGHLDLNSNNNRIYDNAGYHVFAKPSV